MLRVEITDSCTVSLSKYRNRIDISQNYSIYFDFMAKMEIDNIKPHVLNINWARGVFCV